MDFLKEGDIYCICLAGNEKRYHSSLNEFKKMRIDKIVQYERPEKDARGSRIGIWESHVICMKKCINKNKPFVVIFEDDIAFEPNLEKDIEAMKVFIKNEPTWDILRMGSMVSNYEEPSKTSPLIWKGKGWGTHAWIISSNGIEKLLKDDIMHHPEKTNDQIDNYIEKLTNINDYLLINHIAYQNGDFQTSNQWSDNILVTIWQKFLYMDKNIYENGYKVNNWLKWQTKFLPLAFQRLFDIMIFFYLIIIIIIFCIIFLLVKFL